MPRFSDSTGTSDDSFQIGVGGAGVKILRFFNGFAGNIQWSPTASRTLTLPDSSGTIALLGQNFSDYVGFTVPPSPTNGQTWEETDAAGIHIANWKYDTPNTRWVERFSRDLRIQFTATATATSTSLCVEIPRGASGNILLDHTQMVVWNAVGYTSAIKYTLSLNRAIAATTTNTSIVTYDLFALGLTSPGSRVKLPLTTHNLLYTDTEHFNLTATITGAAGFIRLSGHVYYRNIR
jgi:hypothetical protein